MQFPFEPVMVESDPRIEEYLYSRVFKTPCLALNAEQIINKY